MPEQFTINFPTDETVRQIVAGVLLGLESLGVSTQLQNKPVDENPIPTKEVLQILGISEPTLRKRRLEGKVPYIKQGRHIYYFRSAILESLKQSKQQEEVRSRRSYGRSGTTYGR